jgi:CrcB protein
VRFVYVALAGAAGAVTRYAIGLAIGPQAFPWATLAINITGSFVLGFVVTFATERHLPLDLSTAITVGLLGAYTTYSTFAYETFAMGHTGRGGTATVYVAASLVGGLLAAWGGYQLALLAR